ncbi:MAG: hypothetical protein AAGC97_07645 [Planctomycetota bacterium]
MKSLAIIFALIVLAPSRAFSNDGIHLVMLTGETTSIAEEAETRLLIPGKCIFQADFDDGQNPSKPHWQLRKSRWEVRDGVLRGVNAGGNGPFIRLHAEESGGVLPEDYILQFSFMIETADDFPENQRQRIHPEFSVGHRSSFGHYAAKYQWRGEQGMYLAIGHSPLVIPGQYVVHFCSWISLD